jgi:hypothetical protein
VSDRSESLNVTTVGSTNAGSSHADGPAGWLGTAGGAGVVVWLGWLVPVWDWVGAAVGVGSELDAGSRAVDSGAGAVLVVWWDTGALAGLGQTFTRTHLFPRRRRTTLHFGFGFGLRATRCGRVAALDAPRAALGADDTPSATSNTLTATAMRARRAIRAPSSTSMLLISSKDPTELSRRV